MVAKKEESALTEEQKRLLIDLAFWARVFKVVLPVILGLIGAFAYQVLGTKEFWALVFKELAK